MMSVHDNEEAARMRKCSANVLELGGAPGETVRLRAAVLPCLCVRTCMHANRQLPLARGTPNHT